MLGIADEEVGADGLVADEVVGGRVVGGWAGVLGSDVGADVVGGYSGEVEIGGEVVTDDDGGGVVGTEDVGACPDVPTPLSASAGTAMPTAPSATAPATITIRLRTCSTPDGCQVAPLQAPSPVSMRPGPGPVARVSWITISTHRAR